MASRPTVAPGLARHMTARRVSLSGTLTAVDRRAKARQDRRVDLLTDVLAMTRTAGVVLVRSRVAGSWGCLLDGEAEAGFHIIVRGACWLRVQGERPIHLLQGDLALVPCGAPHILSDPVDAPALPLADVRRRWEADRATGRSGRVPRDRATELVCGAYHYSHDGPHPLLSVLPRVLHLSAEEVQGHELLFATVRMLLAEIGTLAPGATALVDRLVDVLLVYVVRAWLATQPEGIGGWLGALRDAQIGRALEAMHGDIRRQWTVEELARRVHTSRASLARRFARLVGTPPMRYLAELRMDAATRLLRQTERPLALVAEDVGYDSEYAFNRAFKRHKRVAPGTYRREVIARTAARSEVKTGRQA